MQPRILIVGTYYPEFLNELYREEPNLGQLSYEEQLRRVFAHGFGTGDAYSAGLRAAGCEAIEIICNAEVLQTRWADEHGLHPTENIHDRRRQIVAAQIKNFRPDVVLVFEWCPLGDGFLAIVKPAVPLLVGQIASPLPENRTFAAYDLMLSCWPPIVEHFRHEGKPSEHLKLAFDDRVLPGMGNAVEKFDATFVGGFAANHQDRIAWLEGILERVNVDVFGYGTDRLSADSLIRRHHHGPIWGLEMYRILAGSRITLNLHARIDVRGRVDDTVAANMRLFEATGVGTCLLTDAKRNLADLFEPDREVVTFRNVNECVEKIRYVLAHPEEQRSIATSGQERTLRDHTYQKRMCELADILRSHLCRR